MSKAKQGHTPGDWRWVPDTEGYHLVAGHSGQLLVLTSSASESQSPGNSCIFGRTDGPAMMVEFTPDHPDARLIAAAPDLLAVALAVVAAHDGGEGVSNAMIRNLARLARAAIDKATGTN